MKLRMLVVGALMGLWAVGVCGAEPPEVIFGAWKLNVAKSKYGSEPPPKSEIVKNVPAEGGGFTQTVDGVETDGKTYHSEYTARIDGKEHPRKDDVISLKKIDDRHVEWVVKKDGRVTVSGRTSYSRDGKVRTMTYTLTNKQGKKVSITEVYDRQ